MRFRSIFIVTAVLLLAAGLWLSFELGRAQAGYSLFGERRALAAYEEQLRQRSATIDQLERELAIVRRSSQIDSESNTAVRASLAELEEQLRAQAEELAFYRGIVSPDDDAAGLGIESVEVQATLDGETYLLRVLLAQTIVQNEPVTGDLHVNVHGTRDDQAAVYTLADLGSGQDSDAIHFEFRYFQALEAELTLPAGFEPAEIELEVWPQTPQGETIVQSFPWSVYQG